MRGKIGVIICVTSGLGVLFFILQILSGYILVLQGDYVNGTNIVIDVAVREIVNKVYWAVIMAIASPFIAALIALWKKIG